MSTYLKSRAWEAIYDDPPSLLAYLAATKKEILDKYEDRVAPRTEVSFKDFWNDQVEWMFGNKLKKDAPAIAFVVERRSEPNAEIALQTAIAFWLDAKYAYDYRKDQERSWALLVRCHYYLGLASGPETLTEGAGRGGRKKDEPHRQLRQRLIELLSALPEKQYAELEDVVAEILPELREFKPKREQKPKRHLRRGSKEIKLTHGRSSNLQALIKTWCRSGKGGIPEVRAALSRVLRDGLRGRGRPKKSTSASGRTSDAKGTRRKGRA